MTRSELVKGSAVFLVVAVAGFISVRSVDRYDAIVPSSVATNAPPDASADGKKTPPTQTPCVGEDGKWKNWVWANVPMLSPKCR
jgi:hypothetical protein